VIWLLLLRWRITFYTSMIWRILTRLEFGSPCFNILYQTNKFFYFFCLHQWQEEAEKITQPILDALGEDYSTSCEGTAFFPLQSCMNHSCCPNAKAFKRDEVCGQKLSWFHLLFRFSLSRSLIWFSLSLLYAM
jgi:hypothetical protein